MPAAGDAAMAQAARLYGAGDLAGARAHCERILRGQPSHFYALHLMATIAAREARPEDCVRFATRALELEPGHAEALSNRGAALRTLARYEEALADYDRALAATPAAPALLNNRAVTLAALGRHREATEAYDAALALEPGYSRARYNRALARLMLGDYRGGWEDYEARWAGGEVASAPRPFAVPAFTAQDWGRGHRIALWAEQGLGDELLFSTLVPELEARGQDFVLEVDRRLIAAFARAHPGWGTVARGESERAFAGCDRHLALGSLPALLRPTRESFAAQPRALLQADATRASQLRERLNANAGIRVGISWRTFQPGARRYYELTKSAPLAEFRALGEAPGVRLLDLQYGDTAAERAAFIQQGGKLERFEELDLRDDIDGVLAAIAACDAVVTTSNVTAHLAGSLGKRTLLVFVGPAPPFHYWVPDAAGRSRWYPSVEIVSGGAEGWPGAMARAGDRLAHAMRLAP